MIDIVKLKKCGERLDKALELQEECKIIVSRMDFFEKKFKKNQKKIDELIYQLERALTPKGK